MGELGKLDKLGELGELDEFGELGELEDNTTFAAFAFLPQTSSHCALPLGWQPQGD